ncbi:MAG TPA: hypothetical protein VMO26_00015 [Vicinamibacterales bacterium]|nr:hypothetical protein [Vicinamibacterales bacterium]
MQRLLRDLLLVGLITATAGCAGPDSDPQQGEDLPSPAGGSTHEYAYLEDEVQHLLEFLRGTAPLREGLLADTVALYIAPDGGGEKVSMAASVLGSPSAWRVASYSLTPPEDYGHATITPGLHFNCQPVNLETLYPELARFPHVGVRLAIDEGATCLQTWNLTFVFNEDAEAPRLTAVVYDQWEW